MHFARSKREIRELVAKIGFELLPATAEEHLQANFPMRSHTTIVDWPELPSKVLQWNNTTDDDAVDWAMTTTAGRQEFGLLLYAGDQPCLLGDFPIMIRSFDELVWTAPGCRLLFGVNRTDDGSIEFSSGIIEFNGKGELFASTRN